MSELPGAPSDRFARFARRHGRADRVPAVMQRHPSWCARRPYADIVVDAARSRAVYEQWLARTRPATAVSPDGTRRPYWMLRPLKPSRAAYQLPKEKK